MDSQSMSIKLRIDNCRAVHSATIDISGLTVVCGSNGVGKSTIATIAQDAIEVLLFFTGSLRLDIWRALSYNYLSPLCRLLSYVGIQLPQADPLVRVFDFSSDRRIGQDEWEQYYRDLKQSLGKIFSAREWRMMNTHDRYFMNFCQSLEVNTELSAVENRMSAKINEACVDSRMAADKPITYEDFTKNITSRVLWDGEVRLYEGDEVVWHYNGKESISNTSIESIKNVFYIESPIISIPNYVHGGFQFVDNLCTFPIGGVHVPRAAGDEITAEFARLFSGDVVLGKDQVGNPQWRYTRVDGKSFPLDMCASGFKSFSILSTLYKYNYLDRNTLLIIDEPEAHLHPAWIVEYAALLVRLVKKCGVRILVASHNPDMVNALKTFAMAIGISDKTSFYQAVEAGPDCRYQYDFEDRGLSIESVFDSFNSVYEMIADKAAILKGQK